MRVRINDQIYMCHQVELYEKRNEIDITTYYQKHTVKTENKEFAKHLFDSMLEKGYLDITGLDVKTKSYRSCFQ